MYSELIAIIESADFALPEPAVEYLKDNSINKFKIYSSVGAKQTIIRLYNKGVRKFILNMYTTECIVIFPTLKSLEKASFVNTSCGLSSRRGLVPNIFFTQNSNNYHVKYVTQYFRSIQKDTCFIYDNPSNVTVNEMIKLYEEEGYVTCFIKDLSWRKYSNLITFFVISESMKILFDNLYSEQKYSIYNSSGQISSNIFTPPQNVIQLSLLYPKTTVMPQINSYWNILTKFKDYSQSNFYLNMFPILVNQDWKFLEQQKIISTDKLRIGIYFSRYLPLYPATPSYNLINSNLDINSKYVWLNEYINSNTTWNLKYIHKINPTILFKHSSDLAKSVLYYYNKGYRIFVLQGSSKQVANVQKLELKDSLFICNQSTDPSIRKSGSQYLFTLTDDYSMINTIYKNKETVFVVGESDNINIKDIKLYLEKNGFYCIDIDNLRELDKNIEIIYLVGNNENYKTLLKYLETHKFKKLQNVIKYGDYITSKQYLKYKKLGMKDDNPTLINFNSGYPFLDSRYSYNSRPDYLPDITNFLDLSNILLYFPLKFLFSYGYITDYGQ
jgi:hypothetical protein